MFKRLTKWWTETRRGWQEIQDKTEFIETRCADERSYDESEYREWRRKKYASCLSCGCPELYHCGGRGGRACEICECRVFSNPEEACRCETSSELFPGEKKAAH